jgi:hypothetical protein
VLKVAIIEEDISSRQLIVDQLLDKYKVSILFSVTTLEIYASSSGYSIIRVDLPCFEISTRFPTEVFIFKKN